MTLEEIQNSNDPEFNMRFWNKYKVGDTIQTHDGRGKFFVARITDKLKYTLIKLPNKLRSEIHKQLVNEGTSLTLKSSLKNL